LIGSYCKTINDEVYSPCSTIQYNLQGNTVYAKYLQIKNTSHNHTNINISSIKIGKNLSLTEFTVR